MLRRKEKETKKHMKKNTKNKISQIDKILMSNKKQNIITADDFIGDICTIKIFCRAVVD